MTDIDRNTDLDLGAEDEAGGADGEPTPRSEPIGADPQEAATPLQEPAPEIADRTSEIDEPALPDPAVPADDGTADIEGPTGQELPAQASAVADQQSRSTDAPEDLAAESLATSPEPVTEDELLEASAEAAEEAAGQPDEEEAVVSPWKRPGKWYVVHTQSGYEKKVKSNLEARIASMNMEHRIYECVIPMEDVVEFKNGKRTVVQKKMFPGYLLVRCRLDDDSWYVIRNTPGITGFVSQGAKPSPLRRKEVERFLGAPSDEERQKVKTAKPRFGYEMGETVRVKEGPFADFSGEIIEINEDQLKVKVLVNIFGRETPVELEFSKIAKL